MNKEILVNKRSSAHHQSNKKYTSIHNKCNHMTKRTSFSQPTKSEFSQITISQFIQDINTNNEASITSPKPIEFNPLPKSHYSSDGYYLTSPTSIFPNSTKPLTSSIPTVPKCVNEYFQFNSNSFRYQKRKHSDGFFQLNLFDSSLFQWEIFNSNQRINYFCRKHSLSSTKTSKSSIQSFIDHIQSQRQYVPLKYSSWNVLFPNYHPVEFSLKQCHLQENFILKNPYGRTGLTGHSLFEKYGANRYIISLIIIEKKYILLTKNQFNKWELPKSKILNKTIRYHTLDIAYIDHPLNTDDTWLEVQIILIENSMEYFKNKTCFSLDYLHRLNNIEHFDLDLIQFYI
jgi:hypothetical protein